MRQLLLIGALFCTFLLVVRFLPIQFSSDKRAESFIAEEAIFFSTHRNAGKRLSEFQRGSFGQALEQLDLNRLIEVLVSTANNRDELLQSGRKLRKLLDDQALHDLIGSSLSLAVIPFNSGPAAAGSEGTARYRGLLITKPSRHARTVQLLSRIFPGSLSVSEAHYGGYTIRRFRHDGKTLAVSCRADGFLLLSRDERLLRYCLDVHDGDYPSLLDNSNFRRERKQGAGAVSFSYLDLTGIQQAGEQEPGGENRGGDATATAFTEFIKRTGYRYAFWHLWKENRQLRQLLRFDLDFTALPARYRQLLNNPPEQTNTPGAVSQDTIGFYWTNTFRPEILLELSEGRLFPELPLSAEAAESPLPDQILPLLGNDFFFAVKALAGHQFVPIPPILLGVKLNDPDRWKQLVDKILRQYKIPVTESVFQGTKVISWGEVQTGIDMQPTFAVDGSYFLIASNRRQIREFVSLNQTKQGLSATAVYQNLDLNLSGENNSIAVLKPAEVAVLAQEIVSWIGTMLAIQDREAARRSKVIIDQLLNPLLEALQIYNSMGVRSYIRKDKLFIEAVTSFEDSKRL